MSFLAKLTLDGQVYNILDCSYSFNQKLDRNNKPSGAPRGGVINFVIESRGTSEFYRWMIEHKQAKDGVITFYRRDAQSKLYELQFSESFCVEYEEHFNSTSTTPLQIIVTITAKQIEIDGVSFRNNWLVA